MLCLSSCGGTDQPDSPIPSKSPTASRAAAGATAGETGEATIATPGRGARRLSPGGRPNPAAPPRPQGGVGVGAAAQCEQRDLDPDSANLAAISAATLCLVNAERTDRGLGPLRANDRLDRAATGHAEDMVRNAYFAHESKEGTDVVARVRATDYLRDVGRWSVGENLAWGTGVLARPETIVNSWMNSPGHRANILRPEMEEIGTGIVIGSPRGPEGATYVHVFGVAQRNSAADRSEDATSAPSTPGPSAGPAPAAGGQERKRAVRRRCAGRRTPGARSRCRARAARRR